MVKICVCGKKCEDSGFANHRAHCAEAKERSRRRYRQAEDHDRHVQTHEPSLHPAPNKVSAPFVVVLSSKTDVVNSGGNNTTSVSALLMSDTHISRRLRGPILSLKEWNR